MRVVKYKENVVAAMLLAMLLGGYLYSGNAEAAERRDISKINGGIRTSEAVTVNGSLRTVNGLIRLESGSVVREEVSTVNGKIQLSNALVGEDVLSSNGDISIREYKEICICTKKLTLISTPMPKLVK